MDLPRLAQHVRDEVPETVKEARGEQFKQDPEPKLSAEGRVALLTSSGERGRVSTPSHPDAGRVTPPSSSDRL